MFQNQYSHLEYLFQYYLQQGQLEFQYELFHQQKVVQLYQWKEFLYEFQNLYLLLEYLFQYYQQQGQLELRWNFHLRLYQQKVFQYEYLQYQQLEQLVVQYEFLQGYQVELLHVQAPHFYRVHMRQRYLYLICHHAYLLQLQYK